MTTQHFLGLDDLPAGVIWPLLERAKQLKQLQQRGECFEPLKNKSLAMIFTKASTRTRLSFETGMRQLGGGTVNMAPEETQMGRGEPIKDTARVLASMVDAIVIRTDRHEQVEEFAQYSKVPVINGLTDLLHPCQLLADLLTASEHFDAIENLNVAWVGDGNNVCHSWMNASRLCDFSLRIAAPDGFQPLPTMCDKNAASISLCDSAEQAVEGADIVVTDTWASMGQEQDKQIRQQAFADFQVTPALMKLADKQAVFMHCLPAYRGEEVSAEVIDGSQSVVIQEAENRLHAQKALLEYLII